MSNRRQHPAHSKRPRRQKGAASLIVVMVLFFIMSLVAAYTSRNLIFEQRTSLNQYRYTQAFEAAEAGLEWALALLNSGRIGPDCNESSATVTDTSFRQRYLSFDNAGAVYQKDFVAATPNVTANWPGCVWNGEGWSCRCPASGASGLSAPTGNGVFPAFVVRFTREGITKPGVIRVEAQGCTKFDSACLDFSTNSVALEGRARVTVVAALKSALTTPPAAPLTVVGDVLGGGALSVTNGIAGTGGVTVHAGGSVVSISTFNLKTTPGSPGGLNSVVASDTSLSELKSAPDRVFPSMFAAWPDSYRLQPAAIRVSCPLSGCREALSDVVKKNPGRVIWIAGDLTLESDGDIGSLPSATDPLVAGPAMIIVNGALRVTSAGVRIYGLVYSTNGNWTGSPRIDGAAFVDSNLGASAAGDVVFNTNVLDAIRLRHGSFVRLPGSWRDFQ